MEIITKIVWDMSSVLLTDTDERKRRNPYVCSDCEM
jgi:hypothetical protein